MNKLADIEGINSPEAIDLHVNAEARLAKFSAEVLTLGEEDKHVLVTAIRQILGKREQESVGDDRVFSEQPSIPAQTSDDEDVPREP